MNCRLAGYPRRGATVAGMALVVLLFGALLLTAALESRARADSRPTADREDDASSCVVWEDGDFECFSSRAERARAEEQRLGLPDQGQATSASCESPLRLYSEPFHEGAELTIWERGVWHDLARYGFANQTSAYRVGACSTLLREGADGAGLTYPGDTTAGSAAAMMMLGWDDRVSSAYIN